MIVVLALISFDTLTIARQYIQLRLQLANLRITVGRYARQQEQGKTVRWPHWASLQLLLNVILSSLFHYIINLFVIFTFP